MKKATYTLIIMGTLAFSCKKEPKAAFEVDDTTPDTEQTIKFTNKTEEGHSYDWDFGDGTISTETSPTHIFTEAGVYDVKLKAYSKKEKKSNLTSVSLTVSNNYASKMTHVWTLDNSTVLSYVSGALSSTTEINYADLYTTHEIEFKSDGTFQTTLNTDIVTGPWSITNDNAGIASINGDESTITKINATNLVLYTVDVDGEEIDSSFIYLSK